MHRCSASAERVFDAWLVAERAGRFLFATPAGRMVRAETDPRVGGAFTFVDRRNGDDVEHTGKYLEIDRPRHLAFTFCVPKHSRDETRVDVDIRPLDAGCEVTLTHELPAAARDMAARSEAGWAAILSQLDASLI